MRGIARWLMLELAALGVLDESHSHATRVWASGGPNDMNFLAGVPQDP